MTVHPTRSTRRTLDEQREEYKRRRFLAMPLAGTVMWLVVALAGAYLTAFQAAVTLFVAVGCIPYLGMFLSRFTGENFLDKSRPKNTFDTLFFYSLLMTILVYAIAIPFFQKDIASLPLSVGILTGLMWIPLSWAIEHWIGLFHGLARTLLLAVAWYAFPHLRFIVIPLIIVGLYMITMLVLEKRWKQLQTSSIGR